jgi:hypothetical protein
MEHAMQLNNHERFISANKELSEFLRKASGLARGTQSISERELQALSQRLTTLAPEVGDASRGETLDEALQDEIGRYVINLRALQATLEKVRCIMLGRRLQLELARRHLDGLQGWVHVDIWSR